MNSQIYKDSRVFLSREGWSQRYLEIEAEMRKEKKQRRKERKQQSIETSNLVKEIHGSLGRLETMMNSIFELIQNK